MSMVMLMDLYTPVLPSIPSPPQGAWLEQWLLLKAFGSQERQAFSFGDVAASSFFVVSDTVLQATTAGNSKGDLVVQTVRGVGSAPGFNLTYISSFSPNMGSLDTTVVIKGRNFIGTSQVYFGDSAAARFDVLSDTVTTAKVGKRADGKCCYY